MEEEVEEVEAEGEDAAEALANPEEATTELEPESFEESEESEESEEPAEAEE